MTTETPSKGKGILFNSVSVFLNAIVPLFSKWAMQSFKPLEVAFLISSLNVIYCLIWRIRGPLFEQPVSLRSYLKVAIVNTVGIICLYSSLNYLDPVTFGFVGRFYVIFTTLISALILKEGSSPVEIASIFLGIFGTFFLADKGRVNWDSILGIGLALIFTFSFAIVNFQIKAASPPMSPVGVLFVNNFCTTITLFVLLAPNTDLRREVAINYGHLLSVVAASAFSFISLVLLFSSYKHLSFRLTSLIRAANPLISAVVAIPFFPIDLTTKNWLGAFFLFVSIVVLGIQENGGG
jgi:drug/metabolite transporter (DMT)-like permease